MNIMNLAITINIWFLLCLCFASALVGMLLATRHSGGHYR
jgi:UPF0716 family protein affecting phage T7 exclusion